MGSNGQLQSLTNSPLVQLFSEEASMADLIYSQAPSMIPISKQKYELNFPSTAGLNKSINLNLLRVGICYGLTLKLRFRVADTTKVGCFGGALNAIREVSINTHNKKIFRMTGNYIQQRVGRMSDTKKQVFKELVQYDGIMPNVYVDDETAATYGNLSNQSVFSDGTDPKFATCYLWLPFACFDNPMTYLDTQFLENLVLNIQFNPANKIIEGDSGECTLDTSNCKLIVNYYDMNQNTYKAYQKANFNVANNQNLNMVLEDVYEEKSVVSGAIGASATSMVKLTCDLNCRNLIKSIYLRVILNENGAVAAGAVKQHGLEGTPIDKVLLHLNGREFIRFDASELRLLNTMSKEGIRKGQAHWTAVGLGHLNYSADTPAARATQENFYELNFSLDQAHAFSSALSAKNSGNPMIEVWCPAQSASGTAYTAKLYVHCNYYSVISISQVNGSIAVSQNL